MADKTHVQTLEQARDLATVGRARFSLDLEVSGVDKKRLHIPSGKVVLGTTSFDGQHAYYFTEPEVLVEFLSFDRQYFPIFHNSIFDLRYLHKLGLDINQWQVEDTMLAEKVLYRGWFGDFGLGRLSARRLNLPLNKEIREEFAEGPVTEEMIDYACMDALVTYRIWEQQRTEFNDQTRGACLLDLGVTKSIVQWSPVPIDVEAWEALAARNEEEVRTGLERMREIAGEDLNPNSHIQIKRYLESENIKVPDTREDTLEMYRGSHPFVENLLNYRHYAKLSGTYGRNILDRVTDGYLFADFNVLGAETSRMSSNGPNMQNIPRTEEYRSLICAKPGHLLVIADFSQQEVRIAAQLSQDPVLIRLLADEDIYTSVARMVYHDSSITKADPRRQAAKSVVLGMLFGLTAKGLARNEGISLEEAENIIERFFRTFPVLANWLDRLGAYDPRTGFTYTLGGHRQWHNKNYWQWKNNAVNSPVQGTGADMTKMAVVNYPTPQHIFAVVHDEILLHVPTTQAQEASENLVAAMTKAHTTLCPSVPAGDVSAKICQKWSEK